MALNGIDWPGKKIKACLGIGQIDPVAPDMLPLKGLDLRQSCPGSTVAVRPGA